MPTELLQEDLLNYFFLLKIHRQISKQNQRFCYFLLLFQKLGQGRRYVL